MSPIRGAAFMVGRLRIFGLLDKHPGPAFFKINEHASDHVRHHTHKAIAEAPTGVAVSVVREESRIHLPFAAFIKF